MPKLLDSHDFLRFALLVNAFAVTQCGVRTPHVNPQIQDQSIEIPEFTPDFEQKLSLIPEHSNLTYNGSALFWSKEANAERISAVVAASRDSRRARAEFAAYRIKEVNPLKEKLAKNKSEIQSILEKARSSSIDLQRKLASSWFEDELQSALHRGIIDEATLGKAMDLFSDYCQAKIWEFAASRLGRDRNLVARWLRRPSPSQLCEGVYQKLNLMAETSPDCAPSNSVNGSDYTQCIWREGVFKSKYFLNQYQQAFTGIPSLSKSDKLSSWIDDGTLTFLLQTSSPERTRIVTSLLRQSIPKPRLFCRDFNYNETENTSFCDIFVPASGEPTDSHDSELKDMSPKFLIDQIEDTALTVGTASPNAIAINAILVDGALTDPARLEFVNNLRRSIANMSRRNGTVSLSDVTFNLPAQSTPLAELNGSELLRNDPAFGRIFQEMDEETKVQLNRLENRSDSIINDLNIARLREDELANKWTQSLQTGALAAAAPNTTSSFFPRAKLTIKRSESTITVVYQTEASASGISACWDLSANSQIDCLPEEASKFVRGTLAVDKDSGKITISGTIDNPLLLGLDTKQAPENLFHRVSGFNDVPTGMLEGSQLKVELYQSSVDGELFFSGPVFLTTLADKTLRGAASFMSYE